MKKVTLRLKKHCQHADPSMHDAQRNLDCRSGRRGRNARRLLQTLHSPQTLDGLWKQSVRSCLFVFPMVVLFVTLRLRKSRSKRKD